MSGALDIIPSDIWSHLVYSCTHTTTICCLGLTAKPLYNLICHIASSHSHQDKRIKGNVEIQFDGNDRFNFYVLFRKKDDFFTSLPCAFNYLTLTSGTAKTEDPSALCNYAQEEHDACAQQLIVIYDYTTKTLTGDELCSALEITQDLMSNVSLVEAVFIHPNSKQIPGEKLPESLASALAANKIGLVRKILVHPNFNKIPAKDLPKLLTVAIESNNKEAFLKFLQLPQMKEVQANDLAQPLTAAIETQNLEAITQLFAATNADSMSDIVNPLTAAILANNNDAIQILLHLTNAKIDADELCYPIVAAIQEGNQEVLKVLLEKVDNLSWHALSDIIIDACKAKDYDLVKKLLQMFLIKAPINEIHGYQLSCLLTAAILAKDEKSLSVVLEQPGVSQIQSQFLCEPITAAIHVEDMALLQRLLGFENAVEMRVSELEELILAAMNTKDGSIIEFILSHPVIRNIIGSDTIEALREAIQNRVS